MAWCGAITLLAATPAALPAEEGATFTAMQVAHAREVKTQTEYLAYANRAEFEAPMPVACLFRAVARAESVHAARHAREIDRFGGTPALDPEAFVVRGTAENLRTAIAGEIRERNVVYRQFANYAPAECLYEALGSLNDARNAEATHEQLFRAALQRLERGATGDKVIAWASAVPAVLASAPGPDPIYCICTGDGCVFDRHLKRCPRCGERGRFIVTLTCGD
jgi:rubrerythrin